MYSGRREFFQSSEFCRTLFYGLEAVRELFYTFQNILCSCRNQFFLSINVCMTVSIFRRYIDFFRDRPHLLPPGRSTPKRCMCICKYDILTKA
jgi:hypothetical protein